MVRKLSYCVVQVCVYSIRITDYALGFLFHVQGEGGGDGDGQTRYANG